MGKNDSSPYGSRAIVVSLIAMILLLPACGSHPSEKSRASWRATLQFTAAQWLGNRVPSSFVHATCQSARKDIPREADELDQAVSRNDRRAVARFAESGRT